MGQFQKGNKLQDEFQTVMANAGARDRTKAIMIEYTGMQPIKTILKSNYLQYAQSGVRYNRKEEMEVKIDPVELRKAVAEIEVGDGLLPIERLMNSDDLSQAFQYLSQDPTIGQEYNRGDLFAYLMSLRGVSNLEKFKKPKEQLAYETALATWQSIATEIIKKAPEINEEQIAKIIGPMPTPEQFGVQPTQPAGAQNANAAPRQ